MNTKMQRRRNKRGRRPGRSSDFRYRRRAEGPPLALVAGVVAALMMFVGAGGWFLHGSAQRKAARATPAAEATPGTDLVAHLGKAFGLKTVARARAGATPAKTYDLRKGYRYKVGDRVQIEDHDLVKQEQVEQSPGERGDRETTTFTQNSRTRYVLEVLAVDAGGAPTKAVRHYQSLEFPSAQGETTSCPGVAGVQVLVQDTSRGTTFKAIKGTVPPQLQMLFELEQERSERREARKAGQKAQANEDDPIRPSAPVSVGERWQVPLARFASKLGIPLAQLDRAASHAKAVAKSVETKDGIEWVTIGLDAKLVCSKGNKGSNGSMTFTVKATARLAVGGVAPDARLTIEGAMKGSKPRSDGGASTFSSTFTASESKTLLGQ